MRLPPLSVHPPSPHNFEVQLKRKYLSLIPETTFESPLQAVLCGVPKFCLYLYFPLEAFGNE